MSFESYLSQPFEHVHENEQFQQLSELLEPIFSDDKETAVLLGNVMCETCELDALFLKGNAVCVIEMKSMGGAIKFRSNGPWHCDDQKIEAGKHSNPFRQTLTYRFAVMGKLTTYEKEGALQPETEKSWGHVSGCVLFGSNTTITGRLPAQTKKWFSICCPESIGEHLRSISSPTLRLSRYDLNLLIERFGGIDEDERLRLKELADSERVGDLVLDRQSDIFQHIKVLRVRSGPSLRASQKFEELLSHPAGWEHSLKRLDSSEIESIKGARRYQIAPGHSMIVISHQLFSTPVAIGINDTIDKWIDSNEGTTYLIDAQGKITKTFVGAKGQDNLALTETNLPLLERIDIDLESLVPAVFIRKGLLELNEQSTDESIDEITEAVSDESVQEMLSDILYRLRSNELDAAKARLALFHGDSIEVDQSVGGNLELEENSEQIVEVSKLAPDELKRLLEPENFAEWMIFLHPEQRRIASAEYQQRALLTGVSGSGKTCVLVHRARHLTKKYPGERIGILTLNRNLSHLLENLVTTLCSEEECQHISVHASYDYFQSLVQHLGPDLEIDNLLALGGNDSDFGDTFSESLTGLDKDHFITQYDPDIYVKRLERCWDEFMQNPIVRTKMTYFCDVLKGQSSGVDPHAYLREEFSLIRSGCLTANRDEEYLKLKRQGRAIRLTKKDRRNVLKLLLLFEETLIKAGVVDELGLTLMVAPHMKDLPKLPDDLRFRCLLIDEFQDLSTRDLAVLQRIVPQKPDALFLTGDMVQQVMVKTLDLAKVGYSRGAYDAEHITKNYRNSRQILLAANDLVLHYGQIARQQNEEMEILDPEFAIRETTRPKAIETNSDIEQEIATAWRYACECIEETGAKPWSVCVVTTNPDEIPVQAILDGKPGEKSFDAQELSGDYIESEETMMVGTMSDVKGFEFSVIVIVGCGASYLPRPGRAPDEIWRDALRLYVAMTRSRDLVYMTYSDQPSEILAAMSEHLDWVSQGDS